MESSQVKKISVTTATIIGLNAMIGSGIFTAPAAMACNVGPAGIVAYIAVVLSVLFMALSLARLATLFPQEGSFYTYTSQWAGHIGGLIASACYMIGLVVAMGLLVKVSGNYLHSLFPSVASMPLGIIVLTALVILNICGATLSQIGQYILIICTLFPLITITILCFFNANIANLTPFVPYGIGNVLKATRIVIFGFFGFECAPSLFSIVKDPQKNVPRAVIYSILVVGVIYTFFITSLILATPFTIFCDPTTPLSTTLMTIFPEKKWLLTAIHCSILSAIIGTVHSMIWSSSTLLLALANKIVIHRNKMRGSTFSPLSRNVQQGAVLLIGACITIPFFCVSHIDIFFNITAIGIIAAIILSLITLLTIKNEWYTGKNIITLLGICTALAIFYFAMEGIISSLLTR